jgi:serine protease Do
MRYSAKVQTQASAEQGSLVRLGVGLLVGVLLLPIGTQAQAPVPPAARELSSAFTGVARQALPAVVFITVEKTVETRSPFNFNNPFDWFGEEFFERFFRRQAPEGQQQPQQPQQPREFRQRGAGSGFIISPDGLVLTNHHVVGEADRVTVKLGDGREFTAKTIGSDPPSDIAVIKIEAQGLPVLQLGNSDALEVGDWVIAAGSPFGLTQTITVGVVSAKGRSRLGITDFEDFIQTDAAINPGNSGGPLINLRGEAIGVNTAIASRSGGYMGVGFAIPINMVKAVQQQLVSGGKVVRGYLGVRIQELTRALSESLRIPTAEGVLVADVSKGSPAAKAGLKRGDVIVSFNGHPVQDPGQLRNIVAMTAPGTKATMQILRENAKRELTVELGELPKEQSARASEESTSPPARLGFNVQNLTPAVARQLGYDSPEGVLVTQVDPDSEAYQAGIRRGMVIREVNNQEVNNIQEFRQAAEKAEQSKRMLLLVQSQQATLYITFPVG